MTRLRTEDISDLSVQLKQYDRDLVRKTGRTLPGIACHTLGLAEKNFKAMTYSFPVAVVPVRSGQGVIPGFASTVRDVVLHVGLTAFVTDATDAAGIAEAVEKGAEIIMLADDLRFIALCLKTGLIVDNTEATARGFVAGLDLMSGGIHRQEVLVLGCGPMGQSAVSAALNRGAYVSVFDTNIRRSENLAEDIRAHYGKTITVEKSVNQGIGPCHNYSLIVEATNSSGFIGETDITSSTYIAAPGMPLGLTPAAALMVSDRLLHDPLQLGVSVMAVEAAKKMKHGK